MNMSTDDRSLLAPCDNHGFRLRVVATITLWLVALVVVLAIAAGDTMAQNIQTAQELETYRVGTGDPSDRYALLVGIGNYPPAGVSGFRDLQGPLGDVTIMHDLLVEVYQFPQENILVLEDQQASRENITRAFREHLGQAGPDGVAAFFFSGHGLSMRNAEGETGIDPEADGRDEALVVWGEGEFTTPILDDELALLLDGLDAQRTLVVIDACYSGTSTMGSGEMQAKEINISDLWNFTLPRWLTEVVRARAARTLRSLEAEEEPGRPERGRLERPERHVLIAAAEDDQKAWTAGRPNGRQDYVSVFTHFLDLAIRELGPAATFEEIVASVSSSIDDFQYANDKPPQTPQVLAMERDNPMASYLARR